MLDAPVRRVEARSSFRPSTVQLCAGMKTVPAQWARVRGLAAAGMPHSPCARSGAYRIAYPAGRSNTHHWV